MITDANRKVSIIAFYLSKFDMDAVRALGYTNFSRAFEGVSVRFGKNNNYMKLRRDEFDALTDSPRQGWNKRSPSPAVLTMFNDLNNFSFEEMTNIVQSLIADNDEPVVAQSIPLEDRKVITEMTEDELENYINAKDPDARITKRLTLQNIRVLDNTIQKNLKKIYNFRCQICGATATVLYGVDISEAHHIVPFSKSFNNNPSNIIILCPDHHRILHKTAAFFNRALHQFEYSNLKIDKLKFNLHL